MDFRTFKSKAIFHFCGLFSFILIPMYKSKMKKIKIHTIDETLNELLTTNKSMARFGDGEIKWIFKDCNDSFQDNSDELSKELIRVFNSKNPNLMITLYDSLRTTKGLEKQPKKYSMNFWSRYFKPFSKYINYKKEYYNTQVTRPYMDYVNKNHDKFDKYFRDLKQLWNDEKVLIVEGNESNLGLGNDLFENALSISRIECPNVNAFNKYAQIYNCVKNNLKKESFDLILIALGPTATILASDLTDDGYRAIDIGHIDLEYEWFKMGAKKKINIRNRYVNEVDGGEKVDDTRDDKFKKEIIDEID